MNRLQGKTAIVTGAARGIGRAIAVLFAEEGANVIVADLVAADCGKVAAQIGEKAVPAAFDISDDAGWTEAAALAERRFGGIDILVNNAAIALYRPMLETQAAEFKRLLDVNVIGTFLGMKAVIPAMRKAGRGAIVNLSSLNAMRGTAGMIAYDASKWAIRGMTKTVAVEMAGTGIRCNSVHPGVIETPMLMQDSTVTPAQMAAGFNLPGGRLGQPQEIARACLFLASDEASYVSGAELLVDDAWGAGIGTNANRIVESE